MITIRMLRLLIAGVKMIKDIAKAAITASATILNKLALKGLIGV